MKLTPLIVSFVAVHAWILASAQGRTTLDGVYAEAQAARGETIYAKACESCHAKDLSGADQAPALVGKDFNGEWNNQPLSDLFERIRATMPGDAPGTLKPAEVADAIAFILSKGGFPAGPAELPSDAAALKQLKFTIPVPR
jgi:mono/diheme cytochrome c family protein